jgi:aldehyde:ferredoxin oxidoreductase
MGNNEFRLSINAKTIILILLLLNVGYAYKKIKQYSSIREVGYIRERTVQEQIRKRIMKSFGSVEEMNLLIDDFAKQKEDAEKLASTIREQDKQISRAYKELNDAKSKNKEEKTYLHKKIRGMADGFSKRKDKHVQTGKANAELKDARLKYETENLRLQKKIRDLEDLLSKIKN